ncbi:hypothetical protein [Polaribacter sp. R77954]|uniref:hypothetical protein n=1 Tax=Polaribacter sp. R77954 TaxID=3093870 RepID=UPI0037C8DEDD
MKKKFAFVAVLFCSSVLLSQKTKTYPKIDSIKLRMSKNLEISLKGHQLLCNYYDLLHYKDSAYNAINKYINLSKLQKNEEHFVKGLSLKGIHFGKLSKLDSALYYFKKVANHPNAKFTLRQEAINNTAIAFRMGYKLDSALVYMKKGLLLAKKEKYNLGIINTYIGLSNIYQNKGTFNKQLSYLDSALYLANNTKNVDYRKSVNILHSLGNINIDLNNIEKSKRYYLQALDTCKFYKDKFMLLYVNNSLASIYIKENKLDSAQVYLNDNINHPSFKKSKRILVKTYRRFFELEFKKKNYKKALFYNDISLKNVAPKSRDLLIVNYNRAKAFTALNQYSKASKILSLINEEDINDITLKRDFYKTKFDIHLALNNKNKANKYLSQFLQYNDSVFSKEKSLISNNLEVKYKTQQKENQILKLENEAQQKELVLQESKTKTNYAIASIFLVILGGGLYFRKRKKDQKLKILEASLKSEEEEKTRIGRELHDHIASDLRKLAHNIKSKDVSLSHQLLNSYNSIRDLSHQLNDTPMHGEIFMDSIFELMPKNNENQKFDLKIEPPYLELQEPYSTHLYRIIQELFTNNLKYAKATQTNLSVFLEDNLLVLNYEDNGVGATNLKKGTGLKNIENRILLLKGKTNINTDNGFSMKIEIPYSK